MAQQEFDGAVAAFTGTMGHVANWKHVYFGARYATRLRSAINDARIACNRLETILDDEPWPTLAVDDATAGAPIGKTFSMEEARVEALAKWVCDAVGHDDWMAPAAAPRERYRNIARQLVELIDEEAADLGRQLVEAVEEEAATRAAALRWPPMWLRVMHAAAVLCWLAVGAAWLVLLIRGAPLTPRQLTWAAYGLLCGIAFGAAGVIVVRAWLRRRRARKSEPPCTTNALVVAAIIDEPKLFAGGLCRCGYLPASCAQMVCANKVASRP